MLNELTAVQGAADQLQQVTDRKVADKDVINQGDATQIARAEAKLNNGQLPPNSISAKAQVICLICCGKMYCTCCCGIASQYDCVHIVGIYLWV